MKKNITLLIIICFFIEKISSFSMPMPQLPTIHLPAIRVPSASQAPLPYILIELGATMAFLNFNFSNDYIKKIREISAKSSDQDYLNTLRKKSEFVGHFEISPNEKKDGIKITNSLIKSSEKVVTPEEACEHFKKRYKYPNFFYKTGLVITASGCTLFLVQTVLKTAGMGLLKMQLQK